MTYILIVVGLIICLFLWDVYSPEARFKRAMRNDSFIAFYKAVRSAYEAQNGLPNTFLNHPIRDIYEHYRKARGVNETARLLK